MGNRNVYLNYFLVNVKEQVRDKRRSTDGKKISTKALENIHFWFHSSIHHVHWDQILKDSTPFLNDARRKLVLSIAGAFGINPLVLITSIVMRGECKETRVDRSDKDFQVDLHDMAHSMVVSYLELEGKQEETENNTIAMSAIANTLHLHTNNETLNRFIQLYHTLLYQHKLPENILKNGMVRNKRQQNFGLNLHWPWPPGECWEVGPTHGGSVEGLTEYIPSSLDMGPSLYVDWRQGYDYLGSTGAVNAAHDGTVTLHSTCNLEIVSGRYSTYYGHISVSQNIKNGATVQQGDQIGNIELRPDEALCLCDWSTKSYSCSTGPHLHFEIRMDSMPVSMDNVLIGAFRIRAGKYERDETCTDPEHCALAKARDGDYCATHFTDKDGNIYCPSVKSNTGNEYASYK